MQPSGRSGNGYPCTPMAHGKLQDAIPSFAPSILVNTWESYLVEVDLFWVPWEAERRTHFLDAHAKPLPHLSQANMHPIDSPRPDSSNVHLSTTLEDH